MQYATVQDLIDRFGEPEMIQLTDPEIQSVQADKVLAHDLETVTR